MSTTTRVASCSCGQLKATCTGEPLRVSICHCTNCQQRTGSVFSVQARWPADKVAVEGNASTWTPVSDSGNESVMRFCPTCGSTVYWSPKANADFVIVAVGAFRDAAFPRPMISVYEERKHPWVEVPADIEHMH